MRLINWLLVLAGILCIAGNSYAVSDATKEAQDNRSIFQKFDKDGDGKVTPKEFETQRLWWHDQTDTNDDKKATHEEFTLNYWDKMDTVDDDGFITEEEYLLYLTGPEGAKLNVDGVKFNSKEKHGFAAKDANSDGFIELNEFVAFHKNRFKEIDTNHDGKTSKEEHFAHRKNLNKLMDQDGDGLVNEKEIVGELP